MLRLPHAALSVSLSLKAVIVFSAPSPLFWWVRFRVLPSLKSQGYDDGREPYLEEHLLHHVVFPVPIVSFL